jgi:hypothetical protein
MPGHGVCLEIPFSFFHKGKEYVTPVADLPELTKLHGIMMQDLQEVSPHKSGEKSPKPWNFP